MLSLFNRRQRFRNTPQTKITDSTGATENAFGYSVALSGDGNTAIVGGPETDEPTFSTPDLGCAVVFTKSGATWTEQAKLTGSLPGGAGDRVGWSVALSNDGNTAIVGVPYDNVGANSDQGSAIIFTRSGSTWTEVIKLVAATGTASSRFGTSVTISNDGLRVAIGVPNRSAGHQVYLYRFTSPNWVEEQVLTTPTDQNGSVTTGFGTSVAFNSDASTLLVGAPNYDRGTGAGARDWGAAIAYTRSGTAWSQQAIILDLPGNKDDLFGSSVALSNDGNIALIGAPGYDTALIDIGSASFFYRTGVTWGSQFRVTMSDQSETAQFGKSVALSGNGSIALIGAWGDQVTSGALNEQGSATVFTRRGTVWTEQTKLFNTDGQDLDRFGFSVALSNNGRIALVGANGDDMGATVNQGSATVFYRR